MSLSLLLSLLLLFSLSSSSSSSVGLDSGRSPSGVTPLSCSINAATSSAVLATAVTFIGAVFVSSSFSISMSCSSSSPPSTAPPVERPGNNLGIIVDNSSTLISCNGSTSLKCSTALDNLSNVFSCKTTLGAGDKTCPLEHVLLKPLVCSDGKGTMNGLIFCNVVHSCPPVPAPFSTRRPKRASARQDKRSAADSAKSRVGPSPTMARASSISGSSSNTSLGSVMRHVQKRP